MYKLVAIFALIVTATEAARLTRAIATGEIVPLVRSESDFQLDGSYTFAFEGGDGTAREERGVIVNAGTENAYVSMTGSYKYIDDEGKPVEVHYTADEHGFVPSGTIIHDSIIAAAKAAEHA